MKRISLRRLRDTLPDIHEVVEVERRDKEGNYQVLGTWTPSMTYPPEAQPPRRYSTSRQAAEDARAMPVTNTTTFHPVPKPMRKK
jgi:hypothetical protein